MPWVIHTAWGKKHADIVVGKGIFTQFVYSQCGPTKRPKSGERKGVSAVVIRGVLSSLASRCGDDNLCCWPSVRRIAEDTVLTTNTVMGALSAAEAQGWVQIRPLAKHRATRRVGGERPHEYHLMLPTFDLRKARTVIRSYVTHDWDSRIVARNTRLTESDNALSDWVRRENRSIV